MHKIKMILVMILISQKIKTAGVSTGRKPQTFVEKKNIHNLTLNIPKNQPQTFVERKNIHNLKLKMPETRAERIKANGIKVVLYEELPIDQRPSNYEEILQSKKELYQQEQYLHNLKEKIFNIFSKIPDKEIKFFSDKVIDYESFKIENNFFYFKKISCVQKKNNGNGPTARDPERLYFQFNIDKILKNEVDLNDVKDQIEKCGKVENIGGRIII